MDTIDAEIKDLLERSGIKTESKPRVTSSNKPLDKFESKITDIGLRLVRDEGYDPQDAGMDILDAVNDKMVTESWERKAGIWYDPYKRAMEILSEMMDEDAFQDLRDRMAAQADEYLKSRDSSLQHAEVEPMGGAEPEPTTEFGKAAKSLDEIRRTAIRDNYTIGRDAIAKLSEIIEILQQADAQKPSVADRARGMAQKARSHFTKKREPANVRKSRRQAQKQARRAQRHSLRSDIGEEIAEIRRLAGLKEELDYTGTDEGIDHLYVLLNTQERVLSAIIPELRSVASHTKDTYTQGRINDIVDQLSALQQKIHGEI